MNKKEIFLSLCGCFGRMGKTVTEEHENFPDIKIVSGIDRSNRKSDLFPVFDSPKNMNIECDVILDFSHTSSLDSLLEFSTDKLIPLVICTTGYSDDQIQKIKHASEKFPIFISSNTSLGINTIIEVAKMAKKILGSDFDIEIIEKHHNKKIDAPSGTALMIADSVSDNNTQYVYDRTKSKKKRSKNEIGISSVRGGGIIGEHELLFANENEVLSFKHCAYSRKVFANGALQAVRFISNKQRGLYSMKDLISWRTNEGTIHI